MERAQVMLSDPKVIEALSQPVRLNLLDFLISAGPNTASECARAVGDTPSNCSYHLRILAAHGLVVEEDSTDRRTRPWRATITGFNIEPDSLEDHNLGPLVLASLQLDQQRAKEHLRNRAGLSAEWKGVEAHRTFGLRVTPNEFRDAVAKIEAILTPLIAATRADTPAGAELVHFTMTAFPTGQKAQSLDELAPAEVHS
jgi:DNA-binding transcriptional ArsR family regulator